jgi:hypothetical protein
MLSKRVQITYEDCGLRIGDFGFWIGDCGLTYSAIKNPQSEIVNLILKEYFLKNYLIKY